MNSNNRHPPNALAAERLDLNKLRTFFVIAEQGGVTAAARRLALTRSAVSHSLAALEESLGVALFHRVGRKLVLTEEGRSLSRAYGEAQGRIGDALDEIGERRAEVRGSVRLGLYPGFSRLRLAAVIERFLADHAAARVRISCATQSEIEHQLRAGQLDFTLSLRTPAGRSPRMRSTRLFEQSLVLATRSRLQRADFAAISRLALVDYFRREPLIDHWIRHHFGRRAFPDRDVRVWVAGNTDLALELTLRGVGACVLPADLVEPHRVRRELFVVRRQRPALRDVIWLGELAGPKSSRKHQAFRDAITSALAESRSR